MLFRSFLNAAIQFLLVAASVYFFVVLPLNALLKKFRPAQAEPPKTRPCPQCLSDIPLAATRCSHCAQPVPAV